MECTRLDENIKEKVQHFPLISFFLPLTLCFDFYKEISIQKRIIFRDLKVSLAASG